LLLFVIMAVATDTRAVGEAAAIAIGGTIALASLAGGTVSGASLNPARTLGPRSSPVRSPRCGSTSSRRWWAPRSERSPTPSSGAMRRRVSVHQSETPERGGATTLKRAMRRSVERELKLVPGDGFRLPALGTELAPRTFVSAYYDTPDLRLARRGVTFRHRIEDGVGLWQLKVPRAAARVEFEVPGPPARPPAELLDLLVAYLRGAELVRIVRLRTRRRRQRVDGAEIVDDSVAVLDGQRVSSRFREIEVELLDGDEETLRRVEKELEAAGAERSALVPKLYRALDVAYAPRAAKAPAGARPVDVLCGALREQYERLLAHDPGTRLGSDPEDVHQMRVAARRARAFLRAARPLVDREWANDLRAELGWLGSALGPARDLDVLFEHLRADVAAVAGDGDAARGLLGALEQEQTAARATALAALSDERYFALLDRLESPEPKAAPDTRASLADLWWKEVKRTRRRFARLGPDSSDDELHAARIQAKRARYAAELAGHELGRPGERFVAAAKRLQDVLGEHQDACVAEDRVRAWAAASPGVSDVAEALLERERSRRREARSEWPGAWKKLDRRARKARP
jgi:CHAD domain-containing protein